MKCSYCQKEICRNLTVQEIFFPWRLRPERCSSCQKKFCKTRPPACPTCGKTGFQESCDECQQWQKQYPDYSFCHHALFSYDQDFKEWIQQYKFLGDYRLCQTFVPEIRQFFAQKKDWLVTYIPLSEERFEQRGFNQALAFLQAADIKTTRLLQKTADTSPQSGKNRQQRLASPQVFAVTPAAEKVRNKKVIIADDVYTTGRTLFHAAEILLPYQPKQIETFSLAR